MSINCINYHACLIIYNSLLYKGIIAFIVMNLPIKYRPGGGGDYSHYAGAFVAFRWQVYHENPILKLIPH